MVWKTVSSSSRSDAWFCAKYPICTLCLSLVFQLSHDALDECGLTLAVSPDEGYLVASLDGKIDAAEDSLVVERHGYVVHLDGVCSASW